MSNSLWPHGLQHARLPWPSLSPRVCSNSCQLNQWCHPTISSSVAPSSFCPWCFPASVSFPVTQLFPSGGQSAGASALASIFPINIQGWFPLGWTCFISLPSKVFSRVFCSPTVQKHQLFSCSQTSSWSSSHIPTWLLKHKNMTLTIWTFVGKVMSLLYDTLSRFVRAFLPRSKHLLIPWPQSLW